MIRLSNTTKKLQAVLGGAITTSQPQAVVSFYDENNSGEQTRGADQETNLNSTTDVDICNALGTGKESYTRNIDTLTIYNRDTVSATVTVKIDDGGTESILVKATLATLETLSYDHESGWRVVTANGSLKTGSSGAITTSGLTMATDKLLGRDTAGTGAIEELGIGTGLTLSAGTLSAVPDTSRPAFLAYNSATDTNQTGDGTTYTVVFDTEVYDQGGVFSSTTFTAPVTGIYKLDTGVLLTELGGSHTTITLRIVTSNRTYENTTIFGTNPCTTTTPVLSVLADMDAADTATVTVRVSGSTKTVDVFGDTAPTTFFSGVLVC